MDVQNNDIVEMIPWSNKAGVPCPVLLDRCVCRWSLPVQSQSPKSKVHDTAHVIFHSSLYLLKTHVCDTISNQDQRGPNSPPPLLTNEIQQQKKTNLLPHTNSIFTPKSNQHVRFHGTSILPITRTNMQNELTKIISRIPQFTRTFHPCLGSQLTRVTGHLSFKLCISKKG